jgi:hypothetical protein
MEEFQQALGKVTDPALRYSHDELEKWAHVVNCEPFVRKVLDAMPELVAVITPSRQIVTANQAMLIFLEIEPGEFIPGERPGELLGCIHSAKAPEGCGNSKYCSQCGAFHTIVASMAKGERASGECRITFERGGSKQSIELSLWCAPFEVRGHPFSILAAVDISDKKRRLALEEVFFHDVLNTFSVLLGNLEVLGNSSLDMDRRLIGNLQGAANSLAEEISTQRDLLLAEQDEIVPAPRTISTSGLLVDLIDIFGSWRGSRRLLTLDPDTSDYEIEIDPTLLRRVISNMIKNALEASGPQEQVTLGCWEMGGEVEFWVHNEGVMPEEVQLQVFQRTFSTKGSGRGQGTYSMRLLSERYLNGAVDFESSPEDGTTFYARYPKKAIQR